MTKTKTPLSEGGVYSVSVAEDGDIDTEYLDSDGDFDGDMVESVPAGASPEDFADPPSGLYVGDAKHAALAVQAVTGGLEGNKAKSRNDPGVKGKIASAIRKFYSGKEQAYYLTWLHTGKKPDSKPTSETKVSEMRIIMPSYSIADEASFPEVPTSPNVDIAALTSGDIAPCYVTRPLAILNAVSENGLPYNEAIFNGVLDQVNSSPRPARRGHVSPEGKSSDFPPDVGYWIGASVANWQGQPTVFGKCYVVPGEMRDMIMRRRATGTGLSNSLYGNVTTADDGDGNPVPVDVVIETIDFVPEERAALQALGGDFVVTREMKEGKDMDNSDVHEVAMREAIQALPPKDLCEMMTPAQGHQATQIHMKECKCSECTDGAVHEMLSDARRQKVAETHMREEATPQETYDMLPTASRQHVAEAHCAEMGMKMVPKEAKVEDESAMREMKQQLSEMATVLKQYQRAEFDRTLADTVDSYFADWQVKTANGTEKLNALKANLRVLTVAEMAGSTSADDVKPASERAWANVKPLAETTLAALAGPGLTQTVSVNGAGNPRNGWDPITGRYSDEFVSGAVRQTNTLGGRSGGRVG